MKQEINSQESLFAFSDGDQLDGWTTKIAPVDRTVKGAQFFADDFITGNHPKEELIEKLKANQSWRSIARLSFYSILRQVLINGHYHADLHPGNLMLNEELRQLFFLDF